MPRVDWPSADVRDVASEIAVLRNLDGGHLPPTVDEFWEQLALDVGINSSSDISTIARNTSEALSFEFDDDYLDQESGLPALSLYEVILSVLQSSARRGSEAAADAVDDDDDDGDDANVDLSRFIADVPPAPWTVRETLWRIAEGTLVLNPEWQRGFVWKLQKQRRLIESMLLGLPIPSFLFFEDSSVVSLK